MDQEPAPNIAGSPVPQKPKMPVEQQPSRIDRLKGFLGNLTERHPQPAEQQETDKLPRFPHGEIALKAFKKEFGNDPDKVAIMGRIIASFFKQEMDNTAIFTDI